LIWVKELGFRFRGSCCCKKPLELITSLKLLPTIDLVITATDVNKQTTITRCTTADVLRCLGIMLTSPLPDVEVVELC
jgi:hypothetical protein